MKSNGKIGLSDISVTDLPYFIGWIAMFIWLYSYFLPFGDFRFESQMYSNRPEFNLVFTMVWLIVCPMITVLFKGHQYVSKTHYSIFVTVICFVTVRFISNGYVSTAIMMIAAASVGHIFASMCFLFFMVLNNSEKFVSMVLAVVIPKILIILKPILNHPEKNVDIATLLIFVLLIIIGICSYFFKKNQMNLPNNLDEKAPFQSYSLMVVVCVVLSISDVIAPLVFKMQIGPWSDSAYVIYGLGTLVGGGVMFGVQMRFNIPIATMLTGAIVVNATCFTLSMIYNGNASLVYLMSFGFGFAYALSMVNIYYLAGFMAKKFKSTQFFRIGIVLSSVYYFLAFVFIEASEKWKILTATDGLAFFSVVILLIFLAISPQFHKYLYAGEWIDDAYRLDVTSLTRLESKLKDLKLTVSETEVCKLLLDGYTLKQIAAIEGKAYATVNTHYVSIYRKLGIQSKAELMLMFKEYTL